MNLSQAQIELVEKLGANIEQGLSSSEASARRERHGYNAVDPPVKCPAWICCLLPCIKHVPSMKAYRQMCADDAEVLRDGGRWIRYDASSLVVGDVIRLEEGDIVPADCTVLEVDSADELLVDLRQVTGEDKLRAAGRGGAGSSRPAQLFWGGQVVQGSAVAIVTAVGNATLVATLILERRFPPTPGVPVSFIHPGEDQDDLVDDDAEQGISLIHAEPSAANASID